MQALQAASVVFCLACICAEVTTLFVGSGWARRCIKAAAGLYILVVFLRVIPDARTEFRKVTLPTQEPVQLESAESQLLAQTQQNLAQTLEAECQSRFGLSVQLEITLEESGQELRASQVIMTVPPGSDISAQKKAAEYLRQQLEAEPILKAGEDVN